MKKITVFTFVVLGLLSFANYTYAQTRPTVPPLVPDSMTGCTGYEMTSSCRPEWADSASKCQVGTLGLGGANTCVTIDEAVKKISPYVMVCSSTYQEAGCVPHKVNPYAAGSLAKQAEIMGKSIGYAMSCHTETLGMAGYVNPINNLTYGLLTLCSVNSSKEKFNVEFDAYTLVNDPARDTSYTNWDVMATELKSIAAAEVCGIYKVVYWNSDGTYKCVNSPLYTDTCVGAENNNKFNYVTKKLCSTSGTSPTSSVSPTNPTSPTILSTAVNQSYLSYATNLTATLTKIIANLKSQLNSTGGVQNTTGSPTTQTNASYTSSIVNTLNNMTTNLKSQLNSTGSGQNNTSGIITVQTGATTPSVELTLNNGLKSGTYSVGETINYQVKMQNVDSVNSFYSAIPKDTCVGGSASGEQKPWVVKTVSPSSTFNAKVEQCQAGSTYIISVVGTNKTSGKTIASSVSVYIKNSMGSVQSVSPILSQYYSNSTPSISQKEAFNFNSNKNSGWFYIAQTIPENGVSFWVAAMRSIATTASDPSAQLLYGITNTNTGDYYPGFISSGIFSESADKMDLYYEFNSKKILEFRQTGTSLGAFELKLDLPWGANSYQKTKTLTSSKSVVYESGDGVIPMDNGIDSLYASIITDQGYWIDSQKFNIASILEALSKLKANHRWMSFILNKPVGILPAGTAGVTWEILDANDARRQGGYTNVDLLIPGSKQFTAINAMTDMKIESIETWKGVQKTYLKKWKLTLPGGIGLVFETLVPNQENNVLGNYFYEGVAKVLNPTTGEVVGTGMFEATHSE